ncbi:Phage tail tube protein [Actinopolyspora alba]|uniref:Phage tail tube protein n=1 Tax=Actinopolyspora alba TaxID=673379 RepID=A0A1I2BHE7_9ACTN|nr:phage tail tube protein [Actinopolyspora alba]SFE54610.1 Phage tail tube protein [Actinopolyspora alba]
MAGLNGFGVIAELGDGAGAYTPIANVTNVGGPETERETVDVTAHDSPGGWQEFRGGLKNGGEVSLELNYDPREHDTLLAEYDQDDPRPWRIVWPNSIGYMTFGAIMTGFSPEAPTDDKLACEVTLQVSGKPETFEGAPA